MKATELMIGDWVTCPTPFRVTGIYDDDPWVVYDEDGLPCELASVEPIRLTHKMLEANGFVESEAINENLSPCDCLRYLYETDDGSYICLDWVDSFDNGCGNELYMGWSEQWEMSVFGSNGYFEKRVKRRCFNVHELQQALRLCGLNEIADGFKVK